MNDEYESCACGSTVFPVVFHGECWWCGATICATCFDSMGHCGHLEATEFTAAYVEKCDGIEEMLGRLRKEREDSYSGLEIQPLTFQPG